MGIVAAGVIAGLGILAVGALAVSNLGSRAADEFIAERRDVAPVEQRAAFADGYLSLDEYSDAVGATVSCLAEAGYIVSPVLEDGAYAWEYGIEQGESAQAFSTAYNECYVTYQRDIDVAWSRTLASLDKSPTAEETAAAFKVLVRCMRDEGIAVPPDADITELYYLAPPGNGIGDGGSVFLECAIRTETETGTKLDWS
jgi:hypothetical protein